jgi:hypothetical protein
MITRVSQSLIRKQNIISMYANVVDLEKTEKDGENRTSLADAWRQINALMLPESMIERPSNSQGEGETGTSTAENSSVSLKRKIEILFPRSGSLLVVERFPAVAIATWEREQDTKPYRLYFWQKGRESTFPIGSTLERFLSFPIYQAGTYALRLESIDGTAVSETIEVHISGG